MERRRNCFQRKRSLELPERNIAVSCFAARFSIVWLHRFPGGEWANTIPEHSYQAGIVEAGGPVMYRLIIAITFVLAVALGGYPQTGRLATNSSSPSYSKDQADRGKVVYSRYCSKCHLENLKGNCPSEDLSSTSYICAAPGNAPPLTGASFMHRFYSVGDLYSRVKWTTPVDKVASLSVEDNLSVVAYLLQANGIPAGQEDLKAAAAMKTMVLSRDASDGLGWHRGPVNSYGLFVGDAWLASASGIPGRPQRWDTVADLYNKVRTTQPAYDVAGLSTQEYLDIVAYLLKQNGLPAGKEELKNDINLMRNMTLDKGFERLFNGKDFTGWGFVVGPNCKPRPEGCGDTTPGTTFKIEEGTILNTGSPHGYMYPQKKFWNFTLRLQYRFDPYPSMESDDDLFTNT